MKKVKRFLRQFHMNDSMVMVGGGGRAGVTKIERGTKLFQKI